MPYGFRFVFHSFSAMIDLSLRSSGYILGVIALIAIALLSDYTLKLIVRMKMIQKDHSIHTYADIGHHCFGPIGAVAVNLSILFSQVGSTLFDWI